MTWLNNRHHRHHQQFLHIIMNNDDNHQFKEKFLHFIPLNTYVRTHATLWIWDIWKILARQLKVSLGTIQN